MPRGSPAGWAGLGALESGSQASHSASCLPVVSQFFMELALQTLAVPFASMCIFTCLSK